MKTISLKKSMVLAVLAVIFVTACENPLDKKNDVQNKTKWKNGVYELDPSYHYVPGEYDFAQSEDFHVLDVNCEDGFNTERKVLVNHPYTYKSVEGQYNYDLCFKAPKGAELFLVVDGEADAAILVDKKQDFHKYPYDQDYYKFPYYLDYDLKWSEYVIVDELICRLNLVVLKEGPVNFLIIMKVGKTLYTPRLDKQHYMLTFTGVAKDELTYYEWQQPLLSVPDGYHKVAGTADFSNAENYGREKNLVNNPNQSSITFPSSELVYLIKVDQPYHLTSSILKGGKSRVYSLSTNASGDAVLNTNMCDNNVILDMNFIAYETGNISIFCNWLTNNKGSDESSFKINFYAVDGFIINGNTNIKDHEQKTYKVTLEGKPRKYLNVTFNYSAVSQTNYDRNSFKVTVRDFSGNVLIEDAYMFSSPVTTEASSKRPYYTYQKTFDTGLLDLNRATIEIFQHAGDWSMSMGPATYVWSDAPLYDIGGRK